MITRSYITLHVDDVKKLCNACLDNVHIRYRARLDRINLEPEKREKFIQDQGYGRLRKWFWMSSDEDFQERIRQSRRWAREKFIEECALPSKIFSAAADPDVVGKMVSLSIEDHHNLVKWSDISYRSSFDFDL